MDPEGRYHLLPITTKERLHHLEPDFTSSPKLCEKDRHRLLGNSWHLGVATEMLRFSLMYGKRSLPGPHAPGASRGLRVAGPCVCRQAGSGSSFVSSATADAV